MFLRTSVSLELSTNTSYWRSEVTISLSPGFSVTGPREYISFLILDQRDRYERWDDRKHSIILNSIRSYSYTVSWSFCRPSPFYQILTIMTPTPSGKSAFIEGKNKERKEYRQEGVVTVLNTLFPIRTVELLWVDLFERRIIPTHNGCEYEE